MPDNRTLQQLTIYLRVESAGVKQIPLQILIAESYQKRPH